MCAVLAILRSRKQKRNTKKAGGCRWRFAIFKTSQAGLTYNEYGLDIPNGLPSNEESGESHKGHVRPRTETTKTSQVAPKTLQRAPETLQGAPKNLQRVTQCHSKRHPSLPKTPQWDTIVQRPQNHPKVPLFGYPFWSPGESQN